MGGRSGAVILSTGSRSGGPSCAPAGMAAAAGSAASALKNRLRLIRALQVDTAGFWAGLKHRLLRNTPNGMLSESKHLKPCRDSTAFREAIRENVRTYLVFASNSSASGSAS